MDQKWDTLLGWGVEPGKVGRTRRVIDGTTRVRKKMGRIAGLRENKQKSRCQTVSR